MMQKNRVEKVYRSTESVKNLSDIDKYLQEFENRIKKRAGHIFSTNESGESDIARKSRETNYFWVPVDAA
jgi:hypothetical protein